MTTAQPSLEADLFAANVAADIDSVQQTAAQETEQALALFNRMSVHLTESYKALEGRVCELSGELSTITEKRRQELIEKEHLANRLQTLLQTLPVGIVVIDGQGKVQEANTAAADLLGEPLVGELWRDLIQRCFAPRRDDGHEVSLRDGRRVSIDTRSIANEPGQIMVIADHTETRQLQQQLSRYERLSAMGKMIASLAHQIRTPLSTAMIYAGHLGSSQLDDSVRIKFAHKLQSRLNHLEQQVRDMLVFVKGETRLAEVISLAELVQQLRATAEPALQASGAQCDWNLLAKDAQVLCNQDTLIGAIMNLINNSVEAVSGQAKLVFTACDLGNGMISLTLEDNGPGFEDSPEKLEEPFFTTKANGTGLGLAVVRAVVKAHKGRFFMTSDTHGARAIMVLPTAGNQDTTPPQRMHGEIA